MRDSIQRHFLEEGNYTVNKNRPTADQIFDDIMCLGVGFLILTIVMKGVGAW